jgi:acetolactate synthase-1/2/3 large subunit
MSDCGMASRKASDVFVECLEAEGVKHVFGIPGEETLDLNESLSRSSIEFIPVRHEQGGAYMADVHGRLTGRAGVCLGTLGPGALNLVTAVADAFLDRAPLVALTGQGDLERMHKESHQYIDLLRVMRPITKWNARLSDPAIIPEVVRKAFKLAEGEKPGATHIELPEDVMAAEIDAEPLPRRRQVRPEPAARELLRARRRRCASSCARPAFRWPRPSWARACCRPTTRRRSAPSASSRATT